MSHHNSDLVYLRELGKVYPTTDAVLSKIAALEAALTLPKETVHVISDIHGEFKKLKHILNNASGSLRPLVDELFRGRLSPGESFELLNIIYYPRETFLKLKESRGWTAGSAELREFVLKIVRLQFEILRELCRRCRLETVERVLPPDYKSLFREMLFAPQLERSADYFATIVDQFISHYKELDLLRMAARVIRNLLISELVVAGDLGDRGPRIDRVCDYIMRQPNVAITWGNHDVSWMSACLGHQASIATVVRLSLRYRRLSQLEEGYGIPMAPLERLARTKYGDDLAGRFSCKGEGLRDPLMMARMQKAIAIIQFKLEGQVSHRNPEWNLESRNLLHRVDLSKGVVKIPMHNGSEKEFPMIDALLPTIDWKDPYALCPEEQACIERLQESFLASPTLWLQMKYVCQKGRMYLRRDRHLIFHGCVPVDESGEFLSLMVDGKEHKGKELFDVLNIIIPRAFREKNIKDLDLLWYLWGGARSPLFGKDRMATFETYFLAEKESHEEVKNPYFKLINDKAFCEKIFREFGVEETESALIVNGHVPVKIEKGENPVKQSGLAVTIDGAFSEAYGDKGYTLVLESDRTYLAQHHHFESITEAITEGADIIPTIQDLRVFPQHRRIADTEEGQDIKEQIRMLEALLHAYRNNFLPEV